MRPYRPNLDPTTVRSASSTWLSLPQGMAASYGIGEVRIIL
jgi:hypothetical protein